MWNYSYNKSHITVYGYIKYSLNGWFAMLNVITKLLSKTVSLPSTNIIIVQQTLIIAVRKQLIKS